MTLCPICHNEIGTWTDDPIKTPKGLAGDDYKGLTKINWRHIKELQYARRLQEIEAEISNKTTFSEISPTILIHKNHILELRQSTEKLLIAGNFDLTHYFNYIIEDYQEVYIGTYKYGEKVADKTNWTDPSLENVTKIKAIHIEELRHPVPSLLYPMDGHLSISPEIISFNEACESFPKTFKIKAYWGFYPYPSNIDVTEKATYEVVSGDITINNNYVVANSAGSVRVSFKPPGFDQYAQNMCEEIECGAFEPGSDEHMECMGKCTIFYEEKTHATVNISSYETYRYTGVLTPVTMGNPYSGLSGSADPSPGYCGPSFSFNIDYLLSLDGQWKCDFSKPLYHYWCGFFFCWELDKGEFEAIEIIDNTVRKLFVCYCLDWECDWEELYEYGVGCPKKCPDCEGTVKIKDFIPVGSYPYGEPNPNPGGLASGLFRRKWNATEGSRWPSYISKVCDDDYSFNFEYYYTMQGNWYYVEAIRYYKCPICGWTSQSPGDCPCHPGTPLVAVKFMELKELTTEITKNTWSASFSK